MIRACIITLILAIGMLIFSRYCPADSSENQNVYIVAGKLYAIDTFKSTVTIKSLITYPVIAYNIATFFVGPDTTIMRKDNVSINSIFDLVMGNLVNIKYINKDDNLEALQIIVIK